VSRFMLSVTGLLVAISVCLPAAAEEEKPPADEVQALKQEVRSLRGELARQKSLEERLEELERRIRELESARARPAAKAPEKQPEEVPDLEALLAEQQAAAPAPVESFAGGLGRAFQTFNPDISVIGDFLLHYDNREGAALDDEFLFRELELGFSGYVDPYARADAFLGIHKEQDHGEGYHLHLEEAYLTLLTLPWDLQAKLGKFKAGFGKVNPQHLHALPWVEYPLVIRNFFGDEGLAGEGASLSWLVPNPWDRYIELTYQVFNNDNPHLFAGEAADDFVHLVHLKNFFDLSERSTLEVGLSGATAPNDAAHGGSRTWVEGLDLTYKWRPPERGLYKSFLWQTELLAAQKDLQASREDSWGMFSAVEHQFARRWRAGARYDFSQQPDRAGRQENAWSLYLTFTQSEYCFWRLAYQYSARNFPVAGDRQDHQLFLQLNFGLGPHRAHTY